MTAQRWARKAPLTAAPKVRRHHEEFEKQIPVGKRGARDRGFPPLFTSPFRLFTAIGKVYGYSLNLFLAESYFVIKIFNVKV